MLGNMNNRSAIPFNYNDDITFYHIEKWNTDDMCAQVEVDQTFQFKY